MKNELTARQNDIVNAAIDLIGEHGVQNLTIKLLAQQVGVTEPALYRHFKCKQDILIAVLKRFEENTARMFETASKSGKKGFEQIEEVYMHHFTTVTKRPSVAAILFSAESFRDDKHLAAMVLKIMNKTEEAIVTIIESGNEGEFRTDIPEKELALILMGAFRLIVTRWYLSDYGFNLEKEGKKLCNSLKLMVSKYK
jgi:AcrR family transcriptional regulator